MSECVLWTKSTDRGGYGQLWSNGKRLLAHRVALCDSLGVSYESIKGQLVRHTCDNPTCVNPQHLVLGTHQDNMDDRSNRGRTAKGSNHGRAKLSETDIINIRKRYIKGSKHHGLAAIAADYSVTFQTVSKIINRQKWQSI